MFEEDLKNWMHIENVFLKKIYNNKIFKTERGWKNADWDLKVIKEDWTETTYEVKSNTSDTHVAFEYEFKWKPSWIFRSKADFIVYYYDGKFHVQTRWKFLERFMDLHKWKTNWWDDGQSSLYVMEREVADMLRERVI